jgi:hypothetical protein
MTNTTTTYKRTVTFLDADRNKATITAEITTRNGYPEFTASGEYNGSFGQCLDSIKPATDEQRGLIHIWEQWHLNGRNKPLQEDLEETIDNLIDTIEEQEEERTGDPLFDRFKDDGEVIELIEDKTMFEGRDAELCAALCKMFDLSEDDLQDIEIDGNRVTVQGTDYLAGDDGEMDEEWDNYLENYIDECLEIPESVERYFDREKWKDDAKMDGRGHSLNSYNGGEEEAKINGTYYYAYRN